MFSKNFSQTKKELLKDALVSKLRNLEGSKIKFSSEDFSRDFEQQSLQTPISDRWILKTPADNGVIEEVITGVDYIQIYITCNYEITIGLDTKVYKDSDHYIYIRWNDLNDDWEIELPFTVVK